MITNTSEYLRGMRDCEQCIPHKSGQSEDYDRGYSHQLEIEEAEENYEEDI